ncbi:MAG: hypothetical protein IPM35_35525 [Myxococcales bacterium]|nr:hypothetical protein [Myxococcales bacterium]
MSGEAARLLGFLVALSGLGCSPIRETRQVTLIDQSERRLAERPAPELARTAVSVSRRESEVRVRVHRQSPCWVAKRQVVETEVHTTTEPRTGWVIADAAMAATGTLILLNDRSEDAAMSRPFAWMLTAVGFSSLLVDLGKYSSDTRRERRLGPIETELSRCSMSERLGHRVMLVLPDGRSWTAATDTNGVARFRLDEELWLSLGERLDGDLYVDGVPVRRLILERVPP